MYTQNEKHATSPQQHFNNHIHKKTARIYLAGAAKGTPKQKTPNRRGKRSMAQRSKQTPAHTRKRIRTTATTTRLKTATTAKTVHVSYPRPIRGQQRVLTRWRVRARVGPEEAKVTKASL